MRNGKPSKKDARSNCYFTAAEFRTIGSHNSMQGNCSSACRNPSLIPVHLLQEVGHLLLRRGTGMPSVGNPAWNSKIRSFSFRSNHSSNSLLRGIPEKFLQNRNRIDQILQTHLYIAQVSLHILMHTMHTKEAPWTTQVHKAGAQLRLVALLVKGRFALFFLLPPLGARSGTFSCKDQEARILEVLQGRKILQQSLG